MPGMDHDHGGIERWSGFRVWLFSLINHDAEAGRVAVDQLSLNNGDRFLDIGCGLGGALAAAIEVGATAAGIDPSPAMVERARKRVPGATIALGSAEEIPFSDATFTAASAVATFHHWADRRAGIGEVQRVLAPGGRFVIIEKKLTGDKGHGLTPGEATKLLEEMSEVGLIDGRVDEIRLGRQACLAVSTVKQ